MLLLTVLNLDATRQYIFLYVYHVQNLRCWEDNSEWNKHATSGIWQSEDGY